MTVSGEAKRGEASMLLRYSSPVSLACGKYLAHLTLFAIPAVIAALLPLALMPFGITHFASPYMGAVSYALVGAALMAISLFIAVLVKHPYVSFGVSVAVLLLLNVASNVAKVVGSGSTAPFVLSAVVIIALITAIMLVYMKDVVVPAVFAAVALGGVVILFLSGSVVSVMRAVLGFISPQYAFYDTIYGTVSVQGLVQPILFAAAFVVFSALAYANYGKELTVKVREEEARQ